MTEPVPVQRSGRLVVVPARAVDDNRLHPAAFRVLCALSTYGDRNGRCWPSLRSVGKRLGICRQAVQKQIRELGKLGYLEIAFRHRENGSAASNGYRLLFDADLAAIHDRLEGGLDELDGGQPYVARGNPTLPGRQPLEVAPIERPNRTKDIPSKKQSALQEQFGAFWTVYPRKVAKAEALKAFTAILRDGADLIAIMAGAAAYTSEVRAGRTEARHIKHASGWLRGRRWEDYGATASPAPQSRSRFTTADKAAFRQTHGLQNAGRAEVEVKLRERGELDRWEWER